MALGNTNQGLEYAAVCRAYVGHSGIYPDPKEDVVHLDHMLVDPRMRQSLLGLRMFKELLARAREIDVNAVEMLTRERTSYRAFKAGSLLSKVLVGWNYRIDDFGVAKIRGEGDQEEKMYSIRVTRNRIVSLRKR